jgi:hypothetical protein
MRRDAHSLCRSGLFRCVAPVGIAAPTPPGEVNECAEALRAAGVPILRPPTDQPWATARCSSGIPTAIFVEIYADI